MIWCPMPLCSYHFGGEISEKMNWSLEDADQWIGLLEARIKYCGCPKINKNRWIEQKISFLSWIFLLHRNSCPFASHTTRRKVFALNTTHCLVLRLSTGTCLTYLYGVTFTHNYVIFLSNSSEIFRNCACTLKFLLNQISRNFSVTLEPTMTWILILIPWV